MPVAPAPLHRVGVLVFDGMKLLDVSGPAEVFAEANRFGANYELHFLSPDGRSVSTSIGIPLPVESDAASAGRFDTVLVSGGDVFPSAPVDEDLRQATILLAHRTRRLASICTGAFVLAAAGLLDGHSATTHWNHTAQLQAWYPAVAVRPDAIFVKDGNLFTSAGVSAGIDLALALVEEDHGPDLARHVARFLVVHLQRSGGQSQFSASLQGPAPRSLPLRDIVDRITADPAGDHSVPALSERAHVSARHLTRLFRDELDTSPAKYVELIRLDHAKALLDAGASVTESAEHSGFGTSETMRRVFVNRLGVSPSRYQQRFRSARR
jgi:transcriptional regulator GlxA family with amidase domain